ncbi:MAG: tRNA preQ1(34) S-adenosylmethionine ribosyltransferase-isomerase QueA [Planctomycetota bacterium]|jgi:S-adenosylmethionine:tRNA ribosyltransferase-isomerase
MKTGALDYYLPAELIAQQPVGVRSESRLLVLNRSKGELIDSRFNRIGEFLSGGDCLVVNDTKVLPARFFGRRRSGGRLKGLFLSSREAGVWEVMLKGAGKVKAGETIYLKGKEKGDICAAEVVDKLAEGKCLLRLETDWGLETILDRIGYPPLPPYIKRGDDSGQAAADRVRYQTVYACEVGAVAAPTAGLHFTGELIEQLESSGIRFAYLTLHVGLGTFKPVTAENIEEHEMEREQFSINTEDAEIINRTKEKGGRIVAVGTTSVRALETAGGKLGVKACSGATGLFIKPGYEFKSVDAMVTNFHLPKSTLLALVAAFAGLETILAAYRHAVEQRYRFYSYGDAMLIL